MNLIFIPCTKILKKGYLSRGKETDRDRVFPAKNTSGGSPTWWWRKAGGVLKLINIILPSFAVTFIRLEQCERRVT